MNKKLELELIEKVKIDHSYLDKIKDQTEEICLAAVKQDGYALYYVKNQTEKICLAAIKQNIKSIWFADIKRRNIALLILKVYVKFNDKNKKYILTDILRNFNEDKKIIDFYTKHKLWKYVNFNELSDNFRMYGMAI